MGDASTPPRRFPRYRTGLDVTVYLGSGSHECRISQISRGGCLIFPPIKSGQNPQIKLSFRLSDDLPSINCKGEILYSIRDKGTGVAFTEISVYNQELITSFFENQLAAGKSGYA